MEKFINNSVSNKSLGSRVKDSLDQAKQANHKLHSFGSEKDNHINPYNDKEIIKEYRFPFPGLENKIKTRFYLSKLLHLIYPENFPEIKVSLPNYGIEVYEKISKSINPFSYISKKTKRKELEEKIDELGVDFDKTHDSNFLVDKLGNVNYVDSLDLKEDTIELLGKYIEANFSEDKKREALDLLSKLDKYKD